MRSKKKLDLSCLILTSAVLLQSMVTLSSWAPPNKTLTVTEKQKCYIQGEWENLKSDKIPQSNFPLQFFFTV